MRKRLKTSQKFTNRSTNNSEKNAGLEGRGNLALVRVPDKTKKTNQMIANINYDQNLMPIILKTTPHNKMNME